MSTLPPNRRSLHKLTGMAFLLLWLFFGVAHHANGASGSPRDSVTGLFTQGGASFNIADFDGDNQPDLATVQVGQNSSLNTHYFVDFHLSTGSQQTIDLIASEGGLQITSRDVNGDSFPDVIVATAWTNRPVAVLLNDGHGNFTRSDPSEFPAVMQRSPNNWICATHEIKDDAAALPLSRSFAGDCESLDGFSLWRNVTGRLVPSTCRRVAILSGSSSLSRGPPPPLLLFFLF